MKIREHKVLIVEPVGRLDMASSQEFEAKIVEHLEAGEKNFVVDLFDVEYISSAGLRVLLMLGKKLKSSQGELVLCSLQPSVTEVLEVAGFTKILTIVPSRSEAISALTAAESGLSLIARKAREILQNAELASTPETMEVNLASEELADLVGKEIAGGKTEQEARPTRVWNRLSKKLFRQ